MHFPVTTLGPGRRVGVWFQGCSIKCAGCISPDTWAVGQGITSLASTLEALAAWAQQADGLTVSGGEPFEQPEALSALIAGWRAMSDTNVLVFTGFAFAKVQPWLERHPGLIDALISEPFEIGTAQTRALRGSDNQTLHVLSDRGAPFAAFERPAVAADRRLDVMFDADGGAWFAGIPARGDFARFRQSMRSAGHQIQMSDQNAGAAQ
jgi:anaerobic ribonucleoside-triphosphate reductase activating protein